MGVKPIKRAIIPILILILLSVSVLADVTSDVNFMNQLNERVERNKVETIKAIKEYQNITINSTQAMIEENFEVLDTRIQDFFKDSKRDIAVVMVVGFISGFVISQIIKLTIERSRRRSLIKKGMQLEVEVERLQKDSIELSKRVRELKLMDEKYTAELKSLTKKPPFLPIQAIILGIITLIVGALVTYFILQPRVIPFG